MMKTTMFIVLLLTAVHDPARALPQTNLVGPKYLNVPGFKLCIETKTLGSADFICLPDRQPEACETFSWVSLWQLKEICPCTKYGFVSVPECLDLTCPNAFGYTIINRSGVKRFENIESYEECSRKCHEQPICNFWTWGNEYAGDSTARFCYLVSSYEYIIPYDHAVSGPKTCNIGAAPMATVPGELSCYSNSVDTNTVARRDEQVMKGIGSADECSKKCLEKTTCNFWTWANNNTGRWALDCILMSGYGNTAWDDNIVSGARTCSGY